MYAIFATIRVKPEHRERYMEEILHDARGSVLDEPGCLRFDVLVDAADPNTLYLYEIYRDEAAFQTHLTMPHFIKWRDTVRDWHELSAVRAFTVFPPEADWQAQRVASGG